MKRINVGRWLAAATVRLAGVSEHPGLDAQALLAAFLARSRSSLLAHPESELDADMQGQLDAALAQLAAGYPLPYLTGEQEFYGLPFMVTPPVLIPRPETELLVDQALDWLATHPGRRRVADVGTGSGCIAVSLAVKAPDVRVTAIDSSVAALCIAEKNAGRHRVLDQVTFSIGDLLADCKAEFDLICANLPYIPAGKLDHLAVAKWEPRLALDGGEDGLHLIRRLLLQAPCRLAGGGCLLLEIESGHGERALALAQDQFPLAEATLLNDLAGLPRLVRIQMPEVNHT